MNILTRLRLIREEVTTSDSEVNTSSTPDELLRCAALIRTSIALTVASPKQRANTCWVRSSVEQASSQGKDSTDGRHDM